ncbi:DUF2778 domain-containing protein [Methylosinus sp. Sm6]|uniref:DUF2778 domain-containing protein n=1 Tax=Methylosinus sp. Sm6 TaxID=2866948 RepID=UPI001C99D83B|nr:DUF2778 domain-containing protein [Methylosinus sp. Sm6]MBY6242785.1 DUF2778 domain-containing protein [Methylosinus sp. Sm6]
MTQTTGDNNELYTENRRAFSRRIVFSAVLLAGAATSGALICVADGDKDAGQAAVRSVSNPFGAMLVDLRSRVVAEVASLAPIEARSGSATNGETEAAEPAKTSEAARSEAAPASAAAPRAPVAERIAPTPPRRPSEFAFPFGREGFRAPARDIAAKKTALSPAPADNRSLFEKFFGALQPTSSALAYAPSDTRVSDAWRASANPALRYEEGTAVYDITGHTVYLPNGAKLEAHSGLGDKFDDPRFAHVRMHGVTPPHVYDLTLREKPFHGVRAIRLTPVGGEGNVFGRVGLLAHTYMLGARGDSNGCVSFKNYAAFLRAFEKGEVKRLVVVARLD